MAKKELLQATQVFRGNGFQVLIDEQQVVLIVEPPVAGSASVSLESIQTFFQQHGWPWDQESRVAEILAKSDGQPHVLVSDLASCKTDAELLLQVTGDKMRVLGQIEPAVWGQPLTLAEVEAQLEAAGICFGIQEDALQQMVATQTLPQEWVLAEGIPVQNGTNARLEYEPAVRKTGGTPTFLPDGRVDFRELDNIVTVAEGEVLATRIPPTPGKAGRDVFGQEIEPIPGRDLVWPVGKGVKVVGDQLVAAAAGQVVISGGRINVLPVYDVPGNVDYSVGNIRFNGSVLVRGSVLPGFTIQAEGDVKILGGVDGAHISCGGMLTVRGGIQGQGRGVIEVQGDVYARFIENCRITAGGSVVAGEDIMHSDVAAGRSIRVGGRKGLLVGGQIRATDSIECKVLGAALGTPTVIEVGTNPTIYEQYGQLQGSIAKKENEVLKLRQGLHRLQMLQEATGTLSPSRQELKARLTRAYQQSIDELAGMRELLAQHEKAIAAIKDAQVIVTDTIFPGVIVNIGKSVYHVRDVKKGGIFLLAGGEVVLRQG